MDYGNADIDPCEALTVKQVAERLHVSRPTVMRFIKAGELPSVIFGASRHVLRSDLENFLLRQRSYGFRSTRETSEQLGGPTGPSFDDSATDSGEIPF